MVTHKLNQRIWVPIPADNLFMDLRYLRGFVQIQNLMERAIMKTINETLLMSREVMSKVQNFPVVYFQQFPYPRYKAEE